MLGSPWHAVHAGRPVFPLPAYRLHSLGPQGGALPVCSSSACPCCLQDFDAEEGEALEEEHEAETELLDALGACITTSMKLYGVN